MLVSAVTLGLLLEPKLLFVQVTWENRKQDDDAAIQVARQLSNCLEYWGSTVLNTDNTVPSQRVLRARIKSLLQVAVGTELCLELGNWRPVATQET